MIRAAIVLMVLACTGASAETLRIATGGHYPPYIFDPATDTARGLDRDLMDEICRRGGYDCTWVDLPMSDIFQALARGEVDVVTGGFGYSAERDELVDFTCPYVIGGENTGIFVGANPDVDLVTARIGALDQSLYLSSMQQAQRDDFFELGVYPTFSGGTVLGVAENAPVLRAALDRLLQDISADGTLAGIETKWLGSDSGDVIARCLEPTAFT